MDPSKLGLFSFIDIILKEGMNYEKNDFDILDFSDNGMCRSN